jgi:hypothetical protein
MRVLTRNDLPHGGSRLQASEGGVDEQMSHGCPLGHGTPGRRRCDDGHDIVTDELRVETRITDLGRRFDIGHRSHRLRPASFAQPSGYLVLNGKSDAPFWRDVPS